MARGPRGEKRPEDPAAAVMVVRLATGDISESLEESAMAATSRRGSRRTRWRSLWVSSAANVVEGRVLRNLALTSAVR